MIKIKMHKKIILIITGLVAATVAVVFAIVTFNRNNSMGLIVPEKTGVASKSQNTTKKTESKKTTDDIKKVVEEESRTEVLEEEQNVQVDEQEPEEPKQEDHKDEPKPDVIVTKDVETGEAIAFNTTTKNETNLKRGQIKVNRAGVEGLRKIVTRVTYKNDEEISSEVISDEVVREPVDQINLVGTSDFNLNNAYVQLYPKASVSRDGNTAPASMILVNDKFYMDFWRDPITWSRIAPAKAVLVSGGSFSYGGITYSYEPGAVDDGYALTSGFCNEYGLACGRW